ncbi:MAG: hypothetical protein GY745_02905 [Actinomycetia bacterium]|nr:hypothetical protein [Actinomycetes bacterium]MCP4083996.1 hypothetical protein [Actinomycetes bacterium]
MKAKLGWSRRTGIITTLISVVVLIGFLVPARTGDEGLTAPQLGVLAVLVVLLLIGATLIGARLAGVDPEAQLIANRLMTNSEQRRLMTRWLQRTRWARNVGGYAGLTWWLFGTSLRGDLLLCGFGGIALGSMAAQLHHVRRRPGPRTASLERRSVSDYLNLAVRRRMIGVAVASAVLAAAGLVLPDAQRAFRWGLTALVVVALAHAVQWRVATRPRPALAADLTEADDLARGLAIGRGLAQPAVYCALVMFAHGAGGLEPSLGWLAVLIGMAAWLYALAAWWGNRRLGLDRIIDQPLAATT